MSEGTQTTAGAVTPDLLTAAPLAGSGALRWPLRLARRVARFLLRPWLRAQTDFNRALIERLDRHDEAADLRRQVAALQLQMCDLLQTVREQHRAPQPALRTTTDRRPRVAWVSPLPPAETGIADYSADLIAALSERFEIALVIDPRQESVADDLARRHWVLRGDEAAERHAAKPFDLFVYHVGNSHFHHYQLGLIERFRGLVVLHDFCLGGLVRGAIHAGRWPVTLAEELREGGEHALAEWAESGALPEWVFDELTPLNHRILTAADAVLVHSEWSRRRVRRAAGAPVAVVPMYGSAPACLGTAEEQRRRLGLPPDALIVCTLGHFGHPKRVPSLLRAVAALPTELRGRTQVVIAGDAPPPQAAALRELAASLGLTRQVALTGRVVLDDFWGYARAADVVVQLRYPTRGESSAALLRALAAGAACVGSDEGPMAEFPSDVLWKVRTPHHEVADLTLMLGALLSDPERRRRLGEAARAYVGRAHSLESVADGYAALMVQTIERRENAVGSLSATSAPQEVPLLRAAG